MYIEVTFFCLQILIDFINNASKYGSLNFFRLDKKIQDMKHSLF